MINVMRVEHLSWKKITKFEKIHGEKNPEILFEQKNK